VDRAHTHVPIKGNDVRNAGKGYLTEQINETKHAGFVKLLSVNCHGTPWLLAALRGHRAVCRRCLP